MSGGGLCDDLITRPEESYRLWCVVMCDLETSRIGGPYIYDISSLRVKLVVVFTRVIYIVSQIAFVGKYLDFRNMHRMSNTKLVNFFILAALTWSNLYDT